jgi:hypothetical protein
MIFAIVTVITFLDTFITCGVGVGIGVGVGGGGGGGDVDAHLYFWCCYFCDIHL